MHWRVFAKIPPILLQLRQRVQELLAISGIKTMLSFLEQLRLVIIFRRAPIVMLELTTAKRPMHVALTKPINLSLRLKLCQVLVCNQSLQLSVKIRVIPLVLQLRVKLRLTINGIKEEL